MLEHDPMPLPRELYKKALQKKIQKIVLEFEGGDDEGCLHINFWDQQGEWVYDERLAKKIEKWAWDAYDYSGAGDGSRYGDKVVYNLEKMTVTVDEWWQVIKVEVEKGVPQKLELVDKENEE